MLYIIYIEREPTLTMIWMPGFDHLRPFSNALWNKFPHFWS